MPPQANCLNGCIITLVAFVSLFSTVCFQMCSQMTCLRGCIITLIAFVRLFSTVCFQMCSQIPCLDGCIITLAAFVRLFSTFGSCPFITKVIFAKIRIHHLLQSDVSSFVSSGQLTQKKKGNIIEKHFRTFALNLLFAFATIICTNT